MIVKTNSFVGCGVRIEQLQLNTLPKANRSVYTSVHIISFTQKLLQIPAPQGTAIFKSHIITRDVPQ